MAQPGVAQNKADVDFILTEYKDEITAWERDFLQSIRKRLNAMVPLSDKQQAILDKIKQQVPERAGEEEEDTDWFDRDE